MGLALSPSGDLYVADSRNETSPARFAATPAGYDKGVRVASAPSLNQPPMTVSIVAGRAVATGATEAATAKSQTAADRASLSRTVSKGALNPDLRIRQPKESVAFDTPRSAADMAVLGHSRPKMATREKGRGIR
jgi:hypothetical protein